MGESSDRRRGEHQRRVDDAKPAIKILEDWGDHWISYIAGFSVFFKRQDWSSGVGNRCVGISSRELV